MDIRDSTHLETKQVSYWKGKPVESLSREELLEVVEFLFWAEDCAARGHPIIYHPDLQKKEAQS